MSKDRKYDYCFTYFLPDDSNVLGLEIDEETKIKMIYNKLSQLLSDDKIFKYSIFQLEKCPETERLHFQGYFYFINARSFSACKKLLGSNGFNSAHIENRKAEKIIEAVDYCKKIDSRYMPDYMPNGLSFEFGVIPSLDEINQGKRTDLEAFIDRINDGANYDELLLEFPSYVVRYDKLFLKLRKKYLERKYMTIKRKMENVLYYEYSNSDEILDYIYATYGYDNVYRLPNYSRFAFDDYNEQEIIVLDNYDSQFIDNFLLKLLSGNPLYLGARYENKVACFTKVIIITKLQKDSFRFNNHIFRLRDYFSKIEGCAF